MTLTPIPHPELSLVELLDAHGRTVAEFPADDALDLADNLRDAAHTATDPQAIAAAGRYGTRTP